MYQAATEIKKVAIYARVSTDAQGEEKTIDSQIKEDEDYCGKKNYEVYRIYKDEGWSGGLKERPQLDELISDASKGLFQAVVINNIDRLARDSAPFYYTLDKLNRLDIKILYVKGSNDNGPEADFQRGIMLLMAALEKHKILERTLRGKQYKLLDRKEPIGGIPAFGYRYIYKNKHLSEPGHYEINEEEAEIVRRIFDWIGNEQLSVKGVQKRLFERQIKTRGGKIKWSASTILRILRNEQYIGNLQYNRLTTVETDKHRAEQKYRKRIKTGVRVRPREQWVEIKKPELRIIEDSLFRAAQEQIIQNKALCKRNAHFEYLFSGGLLRCDQCGCAYVGVPMHQRRFYRDGNKEARRPEARTCYNKSIPAEKIELLVWRLVVKLIKQPDLLIKHLRKNTQLLCSQEGIREVQLAKVVKSIGQLEKEEERVIGGYRKGFLEEAQVSKQILAIKNQRNGLIEERERLEKEIRVETEAKTAPETIGELCKSMGNKLNKMSFDDRRRVVRLFIREIRFDGKSLAIKGLIPLGASLVRSNFEFSIVKNV